MITLQLQVSRLLFFFCNTNDIRYGLIEELFFSLFNAIELSTYESGLFEAFLGKRINEMALTTNCFDVSTFHAVVPFCMFFESFLGVLFQRTSFHAK